MASSTFGIPVWKFTSMADLRSNAQLTPPGDNSIRSSLPQLPTRAACCVNSNGAAAADILALDPALDTGNAATGATEVGSTVRCPCGGASSIVGKVNEGVSRWVGQNLLFLCSAINFRWESTGIAQNHSLLVQVQCSPEAEPLQATQERARDSMLAKDWWR